jgi:hypothetical protein
VTLSHLHSQELPEKLQEHRSITKKYFGLIVEKKRLMYFWRSLNMNFFREISQLFQKEYYIEIKSGN